MTLDSIFHNTTVLITGHTGFKGAWLTAYLNYLGANVIGYALSPPTTPNLYEQANLQETLTHIQDDIRHQDKLTEVMQTYQPDFIFHMAAQSLVLASYENPIETYEVNVMGSIKLLEAIRQAKLATTLIMVVTDKCYQNKEWVFGYRETDALGGHDPYSASKAAMDIAVQSYRLSFFPVETYHEHGVAIASVRSGNVIGGGDWANFRLVPDAVRAFMQKIPVAIRNPHALRPWQHVLEPLSGYLLLAKHLSQNPQQFSGEWNFGPLPTERHTVGQLVSAMVKIWGEGASWIDESTVHNHHEANLLSLNIDKAISYLGWQPVWDFSTTVERTINWYKSAINQDENSIRALCLEDIKAYEQASYRQGTI